MSHSVSLLHGADPSDRLLEDERSPLAADEAFGSESDPLDHEASAPPRTSCVARIVRVFSPSRMLRAGEVSGALGDLGTFLPDVVALANSVRAPSIPVASFVFFSGAWSCWAGVLFDIPIPIQPMHTVVAVVSGRHDSRTAHSPLCLRIRRPTARAVCHHHHHPVHAPAVPD